MEHVKLFNSELSSLYEVKPPISKAKMNTLTKTAIKGIKFYKHVVQSVEKFIQKCKPEYKVPGLYVIDSIVRQSRHQFGAEKDVFAPRFSKNIYNTFTHLFQCPPEDKSKVIRVLNLWQRNQVFAPEVIQPLFDLADPKKQGSAQQAGGASNGTTLPKASPQAQGTKTDGTPKWPETAGSTPRNQGSTPGTATDQVFAQHLQTLQQIIILQQQQQTQAQQDQVKFDKKLLDYDYGEEEDEDHMQANNNELNNASNNSSQLPPDAVPGVESLGSLLANPVVIRHLQTLQQMTFSQQQQAEMEDKMRRLQEMKQQEDEFDKHLAQTIPSLPFASQCELKPIPLSELKATPTTQATPQDAVTAALQTSAQLAFAFPTGLADMSLPPPGYPLLAPTPTPQPPPVTMTLGGIVDESMDTDYQPRVQVPVINLDMSGDEGGNKSDRSRSRSRSRGRRGGRRGRTRSRSRDRRGRGRRTRSRSNSRTRRSNSRTRRRRSRSRDRERDKKREEEREKDREKERERRRKGLPPIKRDHMSVCSTTLWVGHLSKLVQQEELSDTFGEYGDIISIDLIPPRGCAFICMNRRQDSFRALTKLKNHKMQGKAITLAWAPGKGVKGKEWKDYWEVELGCSYIPWSKIPRDLDIDSLEEGGMIDEETMPEWLKLQAQSLQQQVGNVVPGMVVLDPTTPATVAPPGFIPLPEALNKASTTPSGPDTSQPPPTTTARTLATAANPLAGIVPPFGMPGVPPPLGLTLNPGLVPLGVPPPGVSGLLVPPGGPLLHQTLLSGVAVPVSTAYGTAGMSRHDAYVLGPLLQTLSQIPLPTAAAPPQDKPETGLPSNAPPLGVAPPTTEANLPGSTQTAPKPKDEGMMDVDLRKPPPPLPKQGLLKLSDELLAQMNSGPPPPHNQRSSGRESEHPPPRERRRNRDRWERNPSPPSGEKDSGWERDRERGDRDRDRDRRNRDRSGGDRENWDLGRFAPQNEAGRGDKPSLHDRLRNLAHGGAAAAAAAAAAEANYGPRDEHPSSRGGRRDSRTQDRCPSPPARDFPPKRDFPPPERDFPPPERDFPPPERDFPPPELDFVPPEREFPPGELDFPPPERDFPPSQRDLPPPDMMVPKEMLSPGGRFRGPPPAGALPRMYSPERERFPPPDGRFGPPIHPMEREEGYRRMIEPGGYEPMEHSGGFIPRDGYDDYDMRPPYEEYPPDHYDPRGPPEEHFLDPRLAPDREFYPHREMYGPRMPRGEGFGHRMLPPAAGPAMFGPRGPPPPMRGPRPGMGPHLIDRAPPGMWIDPEDPRGPPPFGPPDPMLDYEGPPMEIDPFYPPYEDEMHMGPHGRRHMRGEPPFFDPHREGGRGRGGRFGRRFDFPPRDPRDGPVPHEGHPPPRDGPALREPPGPREGLDPRERRHGSREGPRDRHGSRDGPPPRDGPRDVPPRDGHVPREGHRDAPSREGPRELPPRDAAKEMPPREEIKAPPPTKRADRERSRPSRWSNVSPTSERKETADAEELENNEIQENPESMEAQPERSLEPPLLVPSVEEPPTLYEEEGTARDMPPQSFPEIPPYQEPLTFEVERPDLHDAPPHPEECSFTETEPTYDIPPQLFPEERPSFHEEEPAYHDEPPQIFPEKRLSFHEERQAYCEPPTGFQQPESLQEEPPALHDDSPHFHEEPPQIFPDRRPSFHEEPPSFQNESQAFNEVPAEIFHDEGPATEPLQQEYPEVAQNFNEPLGEMCSEQIRERFEEPSHEANDPSESVCEPTATENNE